MKNLIRLEDGAKFILSYLTSLYLGYDWYVFLLLLFLPDLGMLGYLFNTRLGALSYNLFHHQGLAIAVGIAGISLSIPSLQLAGLVLFGHSAMDRVLGYGLKYPDDFKHTHLGWIGHHKNKALKA